jgi:hypothetical protein
MTWRTSIAAAAIATAISCAPRGPVVDTGAKPPGVGGTIAGSVTAGNGSVALSGRKITATDERTGAVVAGSTATNGGYTLKVPAGTYRLDVELQPGETLDKRPAPTEVNVGDLDPGRNFVVTVAAK